MEVNLSWTHLVLISLCHVLRLHHSFKAYALPTSLKYSLLTQDSKESIYNAGDLGLIHGLERSPGEGNGNPLQYFCLENAMDGGAW